MSKIFDRRLQSGFTLVELIVVIAILAILAGIAIPVYSNYVAKANQAADEQLIAAVNTAAAAAVLEATGKDMKSSDIVTMGTNAVKGKSGISVWHFNSNDDVSASFAKYFSGNEGSMLKWYGSLQFDNVKHLFVGRESILNSGYSWQNTADAKDAYYASNWKNMGVDGLTGTVDFLTGALADFGNVLGVLGEADGFLDTLKELVGEDATVATTDKATLANVTVFYVAERIKDFDAADIKTALYKDKLAGGNAYLDAYLEEKGISASENYREYQLVNATLKYAAATAYAYSGVDQALKESITSADLNDYQSVMSVYDQAKNSSGYKAYLTRTANGGTDDLDAFIKILGAFDENKAAFGDVSGSGLFSNPEIQTAINDILGTP